MVCQFLSKSIQCQIVDCTVMHPVSPIYEWQPALGRQCSSLNVILSRIMLTLQVSKADSLEA